MRSIHARLPKNFILEERLEKYSNVIEIYPKHYRGKWIRACYPSCGETDSTKQSFSHIHLDIGCGKGAYITQMSKRYPNTLFIGVDSEPICIAYAAQAIVEMGLKNCVVAPGKASDIHEFFAEGEVDIISANFPTPFPRKKFAKRRITDCDRLIEYRKILSKDGKFIFKTDSQPLYDFTILQLEAAGYVIDYKSCDMAKDQPLPFETEYEQRLKSLGATVYGISAHLGKEPKKIEANWPMSLFEYLPDDLEKLNYVPYGMEKAVFNFKRRQDRALKKADPQKDK